MMRESFPGMRVVSTKRFGCWRDFVLRAVSDENPLGLKRGDDFLYSLPLK
jgi:hypothetical protein